MPTYNMDALWEILKSPLEETPTKPEPPGEAPGDKYELLPIDALEDFPAEKHKFHPASPQRMASLMEDIRINGILNPLLVRRRPNGKFQILAGHNRRTAARQLGYISVPCIIKNLPDEDDAEQAMISDNLQNRGELLPSEKAFAYKAELEIRRRRAGRPRTENSRHDDANLIGIRSDEELAQNSPDSASQILRFIRLTYLIPEILDLVDKRKIGLMIGVQLSYLSPRSQQTVYNFCYASEPTRPLKEIQAKELREIEKDPDQIIDNDVLDELTAKKQKIRLRTVKIEMNKLREYFPGGTPEEVVVQTIETALAIYFQKKKEGVDNQNEIY